MTQPITTPEMNAQPCKHRRRGLLGLLSGWCWLGLVVLLVLSAISAVFAAENTAAHVSSNLVEQSGHDHGFGRHLCKPPPQPSPFVRGREPKSPPYEGGDLEGVRGKCLVPESSSRNDDQSQQPLRFEANQGQADPAVRYLTRGPGYTLFLHDGGALLRLGNTTTTVQLELANANSAIHWRTEDRLNGQSHYLKGHDAQAWHTHIPAYRRVVAEAVWPGIDLVYRGAQGRLEYDVVVAPGADLNAIQLRFSGIQELSLNDAGDLVLHTAAGPVIQRAPQLYQTLPGQHEQYAISGRFVLVDKHTVGFAVDAYDPQLALVIDPVLDYATYLGGDSSDQGFAIAVDAAGNSYVAGVTSAVDFPLLNPLQASLLGNQDLFISKLSPLGELIYSTYLGGSGAEGGASTDAGNESDADDDTGQVIAVTTQGEVVLTGTTSSNDFPVLNALQPVYGGGSQDAVVVKLTAAGDGLQFATYLGGSNNEEGLAVALDDNDAVYVTGFTRSNDFPLQQALQGQNNGTFDAFISKLSSDGTQLVYSTYLGGNKTDKSRAIVVDTLGRVTVAGVTGSNNFPLSNPLQASSGGSDDAFIARLNASGDALDFATYLGGSKADEASGLALNSNAMLMVVGYTASTNFPLLNPVQASYGGGKQDAFVAALTADGLTLDFATYLGGAKTDKAKAVALDSRDDLFITGYTRSDDFPTVNPLQASNQGKAEVFISQLSADGGTLAFSSYLGGAQDDRGYAIAVDASNDIILSGRTASDSDFPVLNALQPFFGGTPRDAFIVKLLGDNDDPIITSTPQTSATINVPYTTTVSAIDPDNDPLSYALDEAPAGMSIDTNSGVIDWTPSSTGAEVVIVAVSDGNGGLATQAFTVTVSGLNTPPVILSEPLISAVEGQAYTYTVQGSDADGDPLSYQLLTAPAGMSIDTNSGHINWTPAAAGDVPVTTQVLDGRGGSAEQSFTISVSAAAQAPQFTSSPPTIATVGAPYTYDADATGPGGAAVSFSFFVAPVGMSINTNSGLINWTPATPATVAVTILAETNGVSASQSFNITVAPDPNNLPPTLGSIGDLIVPLGTTLDLPLAGNDPENAELRFSVQPLPLPGDATLAADSGVFNFTPTLNEVGEHRLTFRVTDGRYNAEETLTITVPAPDPLAPTTFSGRLLDANQLAQGVELPIVGATVSLLNTGLSVPSASDGSFAFPQVPSAQVILDIDAGTAQPAPSGEGYASFREAIELIAHVDNVEERPFSLPRLDASSLTPVDPAQTTVVTNPNLGMSLTVAPGTAVLEDGTPFTGELSISEVPRGLAPAALPDAYDPSLLVTVQPVGVVFNTPAPITFPNLDGYPAGTTVELFSLDPDTGTFGVVGTLQVSADGSILTTIEGGIRRADWHFIVRPQNTQTEPPECNCDGYEGGSRTGTTDGRLTQTVNLPNYLSLGRAWPLGMVYESDRGGGQAFIKVTTELVPQSSSNSGSPRPNRLAATLTVGGITYPPAYINTQNIPIDRTDSLPVTFDLSVPIRDFASGVYPYTVTVTTEYPFARFSDSDSGEIQIINEADSFWGNGWLLRGLSRLRLGAAGQLLWVDPRGDHSIFRPDGQGGFISPPTEFSVLVQNPDGSYTLTDKFGTQTEFNSRGLQIRQIDRNGNTTLYAYNTQEQLIRRTDPMGLVTQFDYSAGRLTRITDPAGRVTQLSHDGEGHLTELRFPDNSQRTYTYEAGLMRTMVNERNQTTTYDYNAFGQNTRVQRPDQSEVFVTSQAEGGIVNAASAPASNPKPAQMNDEQAAVIVDARGHTFQRILDRTSRPIAVIDPLGRVTRTVRDEDGLPLQTTRPNGSIIERQFDALGNVTQVREVTNGATWNTTYNQFSQVTFQQDANGNPTTYARDPANGNLLKLTDALGHETTFAYNARGQVTQRTDPNGVVSTYTYNAQGLLETLTETPPAGGGVVRVTQHQYDAAGQRTQTITPDGVTLTFDYDLRGRVVSIENNLGERQELTYDDYGNVTQVDHFNADGSLATTVSNTYDGRQRLASSSRPHDAGTQAITDFDYDGNNNLISLTDPRNNAITYDYDEVNRLSEMTRRLGGIVSYRYDLLDRLRQVIAPDVVDGAGITTIYGHDLLGRRLNEDSPDRGLLGYGYDLNNNLIESRDGRQIQADLSYDALNRVSSTIYPTASENVIFGYDTCAFGQQRLCSRNDESGDDDFNYDAYGNLTALIHTELGVSYTTGYAYDAGHQLSQMILPSGRVVSYTRDGIRRLASISTTVNGQPVTLVDNIQYRADHRMTQCTYGNGLVDSRDYDLQGRLLSQTLGDATLIDERSYDYDLNGNIISRNTTAQDYTHTYDARDRLITDLLNGGTASGFDYDLNDNRLTRSGELNETTVHAQGSNRIIRIESQSNSTPLPIIDRELFYNDANRLSEVRDAGTLTASYIYNAQGQRTRKTTSQETIVYHYDQRGQLIAETQADGSLIREYIWKDGEPVAQIEASGGVETLIYLHTDHLMTPRFATDDSGTIIWRWEGEAFGENPADEDPDGDGVLTVVNLRFPGQYHDSESGLHQNWFRDYDPSTGRYIESDPIGLEGGINTYAYVGGNPIINTDVMGLVRDRTGPTGYPCIYMFQDPPKPYGRVWLIFRLWMVKCYYYCGPDDICLAPDEWDDYIRTDELFGIIPPTNCPPQPRRFGNITIPF